jgi:S-DNA-T family DNA segregation ATPase FtsK/SpoIIIE
LKKYSLNGVQDKVVNDKKSGYILALFGFLGFLSLAISFLAPIKRLLIGTFGLAIIIVFFVMLFIGIALTKNKKYAFSKKYLVYISATFFSVISLLQLLFTSNIINDGFGEFITNTYNSATPGGVVMSLVIYPFYKLLYAMGAYVFFGVLLIICIALVVDYFHYSSKKSFRSSILNPYNEKAVSGASGNAEGYKTYEVVSQRNTEFTPNNVNNSSTLSQQVQALSQTNAVNSDARKKLGLDNKPYSPFANRQPPVNYNKSEKETESFSNMDSRAKKDFILTPPTSYANPDIKHSYNEAEKATENLNTSAGNSPNFEHRRDRFNLFGKTPDTPENYTAGLFRSSEPDFKTSAIQGGMANSLTQSQNNNLQEANQVTAENSQNSPFDVVLPTSSLDSTERSYDSIYGAKLPDLEPTFIDGVVPTRFRNKNILSKTDLPSNLELKAHKISKYVRPTFELLNTISTNPEDFSEDYEEKAKTLMRTLGEFGIPAKVIQITRGPAVTRYELQMPAGIPVKRIQLHADDIAMALASYGEIRVEAPIPGKSAVGVEVPNEHIDTIALKDILYSKEFMDHKSPLAFGIGKDISDEIKIGDLQKMPHFLVAGATGSGKSVCLNSIIISFLYKTSPEDLRLILIDPKRVEFAVYNGLPHLMLPQVITECDQAVNAFEWAIKEMDRRYNLFQTARVKDIKEYNNLGIVESGEEDKLPLIVIIVDELADLMLISKREIENKINRLAAKSRAAGIHLIIATQRPSVDIITGTIKANLPTRAAFMVTSFADSKTILDRSGAEKLLGRGDMLYAPQDLAEPVRIQGAYVSNEEVKAIVEFIKKNNEGYFDESIEKNILYKENANDFDGENTNNSFDSIMPEALKLVIESGQASISMIQRRFSVGYARAARIIDQMERAKYVSPSDGSKARTVYITMEQFKEKYGEDI